MKTLILFVILIFLSLRHAANAQGTFSPGTYYSDPNSDRSGGTLIDTRISGAAPGGYGLAFGNGYQAQYYIGPAGTTDPNALIAIGPQAGYLGSGPSDVAGGAGYWAGNGNAAITTSFATGATVTLQLRAWVGGPSSTFWTATIRGQSPLLQVILGTSAAPGTVMGLPNMYIPTPEAQTSRMLLVGALFIFAQRRRVAK